MEATMPEYLGDSVYIKVDGDCLVLYLDNGDGPHTEIVLEPQVYRSMRRYVREHMPQAERLA
jgi:hypothetical protein